MHKLSDQVCSVHPIDHAARQCPAHPNRWLPVTLRRERPLHTVAVRIRISPSRISGIQQSAERNPLTPEQLRVFTQCEVRTAPVRLIGCDQVVR